MKMMRGKARSRRRIAKGTRSVWAVLAATLLAASSMILATGPASAATQDIASIVCGGQKWGPGWQTYPAGGYVGEGCGAGIDYVATPTSDVSIYNFGVLGTTSHVFEAWIPTAYATANMDFRLYICGNAVYDTTVPEAVNYNWYILFDGISWYDPGCPVSIEAWTGTVSANYFGLDAIRSHV